MKTSVYDIVTETILSGLKKGRIPWKRSWSSYGGLPQNFASGRRYRGINMLLLALNCFESPYYLTFHQVKKMGGHIKKGSESQLVVFWKVYKKTVGQPADHRNEDETLKTQQRFVLRYYNLFNSSQIEGIDFPEPQRFEHDPIKQAETIWENYPDRPNLSFGGGQAKYAPHSDLITLPERNRFVSAEAYYKTLFHEAIHSTGHPDRLDRDLTGQNERKSYCFEELIAEIGASFLSTEAGLKTDEKNTQAYINGWISFLEEEHSRTIVSAASKAKHAAAHILGQHTGGAKDSAQTPAG
jgi:antirestriction protein ArdC